MAALAVSPLKNIREEISSSGTNTPRKPPSPTTDATESTLNQPHSSNVTPRRQRGASVSSRVSVDHFDPAGVNQLRRTMSRQNEFSKPGKSQTSQSSGDVPEDSFDFEKALGDYILRSDEAQIKRRELGVSFQNLRVVGIGATATLQNTIWSMLNVFGYLGHLVHEFRHPPTRDILSGFEGVVRPGEMLLVLGRPGSGCTTLLKILANQRQDYHQVFGEVNYDSLSPEVIAKHYRGDVMFCEEEDIHFPSLTVKQTLDFAARMRTPQHRIDNVSRDEHVDGVTSTLTTLFGLGHTLNTPVGDAAIRGVSGGEKKRVSICEALACLSKINSWDNSTRGLDASTALEFGTALRLSTDIVRNSTIVSLYQAGESLYKHFDKVCVIYSGKMAYFGPAREARQYFIDMGYAPHNRQTTADFLVSVTDPNGRTRRANHIGPIPSTADEFAAYFLKSSLGSANSQDIQDYKREFVGKPDKANDFMHSAREERARYTNVKSPYTVSMPMQARAVMKRRVQIMFGNKISVIFTLISFIVQAVIMGTVFIRTPEATSAYFSRGGVLFFALLFSAISAMAEIPALFGQRIIIAKHQKAAMYHPFIEALAVTLVDIPITAITILIFGAIIYEAVRLQQSASQFFIFYIFLLSMSLTMKGLFRAIAAAFSSAATAQAFAGIFILGLVIYTGYTIPNPSMIGALRWITYINPMKFGFEGIISNEFSTLNGTCSSYVPSGPGYETIALANRVCTTVGSKPGSSTVDGNDFIGLSYGFYRSKLWFNFGIVLVFGAGLVTILLFFSEFKSLSSAAASVTVFKRNTKTSAVHEAENETSVESGEFDEEKGPKQHRIEKDETKVTAQAQEALANVPAMDNVFSWQNLEYTVNIGHDETRRLLDNVSGYVAPGKLTALMGESGAGKTTLLNVLAERTSTGVIRGNRLVNGQPLPNDFQAQTGYCQQTDTHMPESTVFEALLFSARLRQPASTADSEKVKWVETCLRMCGLEPYRDAIVGSLGIEQKKRTTIAVELAAKPKLLLFLDEPTSGLDSQSAWAIMAFLRSLADNGQAILCTIHQPSAELFEVFDRLLLLKKGGQTVYFGDTGTNARTLINYFESHDSRPIRDEENPAEFMLDVIGAGATAKSEQDWHDVWQKSDEYRACQQEMEVILQDGRNRPAIGATIQGEFASSWTYQLIQLLKRSSIRMVRDPTYLLSKLSLNVAAGLFIGFTFFKAKDSIQGTQNKLFAIYMSTILSVPLSNQIQGPFIDSRTLYEIRERPSRMYSWSALLTAQYLSEVPWNIFGSSIYFLCWYFTVGFPTDRAGYTYLLMGVVFPLYYTSISMAIAAMAPNVEIAGLIFGLIFSFVLTFNGVLQPFAQLGWWQWMYYLSPFTYLIEGLFGQSVGNLEIVCSSSELVTLNPPGSQSCGDYLKDYISRAGGYLNNPEATASCAFCPYSQTNAFMGGSFNILYENHWRDFGFLIAYIAFNIACIYAFTWFFRIRSSWITGAIRKQLNQLTEKQRGK